MSGVVDGFGVSGRRPPTNRLRVVDGRDPGSNFPGREVLESGGDFELPSVLATRFDVVEELGGGGQADVVLVSEREGGELRVLKLYSRVASGTVNGHLLDLVRDVTVPGGSADGLFARLFEWGRAGGRVYEVVEHYELGTLAGFVDSRGGRIGGDELRGILEQLAVRIGHLHGLRVQGDRAVHLDLKPGNVLVNSSESLSLLLADWGISTLIAQSVVQRVSKFGVGTQLYSPPEAAHGAVSPAWDWWSLGMIIAELALGKHLFAGVDGLVPSDVRVAVMKLERPDLSGVGDDRLRLLCAGLLTRDPGDRWGGVEVGEWLAGGSPVVREVTSATGVGSDAEVRAGVVDGPAVQPFVLGGVAFSDPVLLAGALAGDWGRAREIVANTGEYRKDHQLLLGFLESAGLRDATVVLQSAGVDPDLRLVRFLCALDPACPPVFRGYDVSPSGLVGLGGQAAGGDEAAVEAVAALADLPVLSSYHSSDAALPLIDGIWAEESRQLDALLAQCDGDDDPRRELADQRDRLQGYLLQVVSDTSPTNGAPHSRDSGAWAHLTRRADDALADAHARLRPWFERTCEWYEKSTQTNDTSAATELIFAELRPYALAQEEARLRAVEEWNLRLEEARVRQEEARLRAVEELEEARVRQEEWEDKWILSTREEARLREEEARLWAELRDLRSREALSLGLTARLRNKRTGLWDEVDRLRNEWDRLRDEVARLRKQRDCLWRCGDRPPWPDGCPPHSDRRLWGQEMSVRTEELRLRRYNEQQSSDNRFSAKVVEERRARLQRARQLWWGREEDTFWSEDASYWGLDLMDSWGELVAGLLAFCLAVGVAAFSGATAGAGLLVGLLIGFPFAHKHIRRRRTAQRDLARWTEIRRRPHLDQDYERDGAT